MSLRERPKKRPLVLTGGDIKKYLGVRRSALLQSTLIPIAMKIGQGVNRNCDKDPKKGRHYETEGNKKTPCTYIAFPLYQVGPTLI